jgi:hypothetical protein
MKRFIILSIFTLLSVSAFGQSRTEALLRFQQRRNQTLQEFQENRRKAYADFIRKRWEAWNVETPEELPMRVEPDQPVVKPVDDVVSPAKEIEATPKVIETEIIIPTTEEFEIAPTEIPSLPPARRDDVRFDFYGAKCEVTFDKANRFTLSSIDENSVADAWLQMDNEAYDRLIADSKALKDELCLNDWGYNLLVKHVAEEICGADSNESVVLRAFLLGESGYKMRLARCDSRLVLLIAAEQNIYGRHFINIRGDKFYIFETLPNMSIHVCNNSIDAEQALCFKMPTPPALPYAKGNGFSRNNPRNGDTLNIVPNTNLMDFYSDYPQCDWSIFAETSFSDMVYLQLLGPLQKMVKNKSEVEALQNILSMIQFSFPYQTDAQQFGCERTFFADEMFAYMYSDCEDRSILLCRIVKDILNLDAVLLHYPNHIAAAVCLRSGSVGDTIMVGDKCYTICDPTYVGSDIGESMPKFKNVAPSAIITVE